MHKSRAGSTVFQHVTFRTRTVAAFKLARREPASADHDSWRVDVMQYIRNRFIRHSASF